MWASDLDGTSLTYIIVSEPVNGVLGSLNASAGTVTYTPNLNFNGSDSFTFKVNDGTVDSNTATTTINITAVNDAPILSAIGNKSVNELVNLTFTASATDPDNSVAYSLTSQPTGATINITTGVFSFTPTESQGLGSFTLTVNATDGTLTDSEEITITVSEVNIAPVSSDASLSTNEDTAKVITLSSTDADLPANMLTYSIVSGVANGILGTISGNQLTYTPDSNYNGSDSFTFRVNDGTTNSNTATISLTVDSVNDAPVSNNDVAAVNEDETLSIAKSDLVLDDTDVDGDVLTISSVSNGVNGSVSIDGDNVVFTPSGNYFGSASFDYTISDGDLTNTATVFITVASINDAPVCNDVSLTTDEDTEGSTGPDCTDVESDSLIYQIMMSPNEGNANISGGSLTYSPLNDFNGTDQFTYAANDGLADSNAANVNVTINAVNDLPLIDSVDQFSTAEDTALEITEDDLLVNTTDVDGDTLLVIAVGSPANGSVVLEDSSVIFTPTTNFNSDETGEEASFEFTVSDGSGGTDTAIVSITFFAVNDVPVAVNDVVNTGKNTLLSLLTSSLLNNDNDVENDVISLISVNDPLHGTVELNGLSINFTPETDFIGVASFEYVVSDGNGGTDTGIVTIAVLSDTQTAPDSDGEATVDDTNPEVVITDPDQEVDITINSGTTNPTINVSEFITGGTGTLPKITINSTVADVTIPATTLVTGPTGWNGIINAPTAGTPAGGNAPAGFSVGNTVISIGSDAGTLVFDNPVTIVLPGVTGTVGYRPSGSNTWQTITNVCPDPYSAPGNPPATSECAISNGTDTKIVTYHFTSFAGLNAVTSTTSLSSSSQGLSAASAPSCNDTNPGSAPTLLSVVPGSNSVTLTWDKAVGPVSYYLVNYSRTAGKFEYGNPNVGGSDTTNYTVSGLSGGTTYYFKVRAGNGCAPGEYSNEISATPGGEFISTPAIGFSEGVLGAATTDDLEESNSEEVKGQSVDTSSPGTQSGGFLGAVGRFFEAIIGFFASIFR